jgi:hypothetical protein
VSQSTPGAKSVFNNHSIPRVLQRLEAGLSDFQFILYGAAASEGERRALHHSPQ